MSVYLKVKLKSLAAEARIIRREERKAKLQGKPELRLGLYEHRIGIVREEARATHVAYTYLRAHAYASVEPKCYTPPDWSKVAAMLVRYGPFSNKDEALKAVTTWAKPIPATQPEVAMVA